MRIVMNAVNTASAGGWGVFRGLVPALSAVATDDEITVLLPPGNSSLPMRDGARVVLVPQVRRGPRMQWRLVDDFFRLPAIARRLQPDVFFSITDLAPSRVGCPHVLLLHNPWVTYRLSRRQIGPSLRDQLIYAAYYPARFRRLWPRLARVIVQTPVMGDRLRARFGVPAERITVIPPGCLLNPGGTPLRRRRVTSAEPLRLFWPARAYPHKNHDVLAPLCRELMRRGLSDRVHFYLTVDTRSDRRGQRLLKGLRHCSSMVTNLGPLAKQQVERWFDQTDALFLPTLLESFSLTYLEAAARRRPIVTSDRDFARHACGDAGYYVDPENPGDICDRLRELTAHLNEGTVRIPDVPRDGQTGTSWNDVAARILSVLHEAAGAGGRGTLDVETSPAVAAAGGSR